MKFRPLTIPRFVPFLRQNHHAWQNVPSVMWISESVPVDFLPIGTIMPTDDETRLSSDTTGNWHSLTVQPLAQWRWEHDREAVLAEDREKKKKGCRGT